MKHRINLWILVLMASTLLGPANRPAMAQLCGNFQQVPTPNPGTTGNSLGDVAAADDGTAWAIGSKSGPATLPLILFFDGHAWAEYPVPEEVEGIAFSTTGSTPEGDVWLAGSRAYSVYEQELFFLRMRDGDLDRIDSVLTAGAPVGLSATSSTDVWALTSRNTLVRFDGSGWTVSEAPLPFLTLNYPEAIHAAGPDDVWIVGYGGDQRGEYKGYVQHWDGSSWTEVATPVTGQEPVFFEDIDGSAADDIWIVGHFNWSQHLSLHWDGSDWSMPEAPPANAPLTQVAVLSPTDAWAAPYSLSAGFTFYQWDGTAWHERSSPDIPGASTTAWRGLAKVASCDVWAAGSYYVEPHHATLVARLAEGAVLATPSTPAAARLIGNHPNPFNPMTTIAFAVERTQRVNLAVFDVEGRRVATIADRIFEPGHHTATWPGRDHAGRAMASGTYMVRMETVDGVEFGKMTLVR